MARRDERRERYVRAIGIDMTAMASAFAGILAGLRPVRGSRRRRDYGFNCCEHCGARLPRHPEQTWRYDGVCADCGREQAWAPSAPAA
jgi:hypothetical protein